MINIYMRPNNNYESRGSNPQENKHHKNKQYKNSCCMFTMYLITHIIISFFAIYLSFKCNQGSGGQFNPIHFAADTCLLSTVCCDGLMLHLF